MGEEQLPAPPGDADQSRVASLRSTWTAIVPAGPVEYQTGWQIAKPDVMYLLDLAEEALAQRAVVVAAKDLAEAHYSWDTREPEPGSPLARLRAALLAARA